MGSRLPSRLLQHANATQLFQTDCRHSRWGCSVFLRDMKHQVTHTHDTSQPDQLGRALLPLSGRREVCATLDRRDWSEQNFPFWLESRGRRAKLKLRPRATWTPARIQTRLLQASFPAFIYLYPHKKCLTKDPYPHDTTKNAAIIMPDH